MKSKWTFWALALILSVLIIFLFIPERIATAWKIGCSVLAAALLFILYFGVMKSMSTVEIGMSMLREQDFNSKLVKVGQPDADKIVNLFNLLMNRLKEERLRFLEQSNFHKLVMDASPLGIAILDFDKRVQTANKAFLDITGVNSLETIKGLRLEQMQGEIIESLLSVADGENETFRLSDTQIFRCTHHHFIEKGFKRDFYMIERLTREVMKAEKEAYEKVIRMLAHEVNNTMGGVGSLIQTLTGILTEDKDLAEALESCGERCYSLSKFVTSFASVVKIPAPEKKRVNINSEIKRLLPFLEGMCSGNETIELDLSEENIFAEVDTLLMDQALVNIVKNSLESIRTDKGNENGKIVIRTSVSPRPVLQIIDNGAGVDEKNAKKLFTPFFSTKHDGQGLGLILIREILNGHSFSFSLKTNPQDKFTRFTINL